MRDALRTIHVVGHDDAVLAQVQSAVTSGQQDEFFAGWAVAHAPTHEDLITRPPAPGDVLLIDAWARGRNVYEFLRQLTGRTRCRTFVVVEERNALAEPIARFCGASGVIHRPLNGTKLRAAFETGGGALASLPTENRGLSERGDFVLPEALLRHISSGEEDRSLVKALVDPSTGLFNYAFLNYKLDEEFKRARRFDTPLACVMLGFEGQATPEVLRELAGIFLSASRDTDVLGRFDESSFLFLLPSTGPDGAQVMARRVVQAAAERGLRDLVGDPMELAIGITNFPQRGLVHREDLYRQAREAYLEASRIGGGVVVAGAGA
ncbi:MAG: GGDEF domain-containing protein [Planctomycetota bacterium]